MNGNNVVRLVLTAFVLIWAVISLTPMRDTPFEDYLYSRITAESDADEIEVTPQSENLEDFQALVERAKTRLSESANDPENPIPSLYTAIRVVANEEAIDLSKYFSDLRILDVANIKKKNDIVLGALMRESRGKLQPGLDLAGGLSVTFQIPEEKLESPGFLRDEQLKDARQVILDRIDALGVAEPIARVKGDSMIEVQIAADSNVDPGTIGKPALLEFSEVHRTQRPYPGSTPPLGYVEKVQEIEDPDTGEMIEQPLYVKRIPAMTGKAVQQARAQLTGVGGFEVGISFTSDGGQKFAELTGKIASENSSSNVGRLAIILDGKLVSAPTVRERINGGNAVITGNFSQREAIGLANALNNPLEVPLNIVEMNQVEPTLATSAQQASTNAAIIGASLVALFMIVWYGVGGILAMITVAANVLIVLAALASMNATITLPGIAALVLTIGMAVDANILIFERIREELKAGKSIGHAVTDGYNKVFSTIMDANVTTLITSLILIYFGTGPVKGFGVTLSVGILSTVFCALIMSRWMIEGAVKIGFLRNVPTRVNALDRSQVPFMNSARRAFAFSWAIVVIGIVAFVAHFDNVFGIDFKGGDELTVSYEQALSSDEIIDVANANGFQEVNPIFQTPVGATTPTLIIQTESDQGDNFFAALTESHPEAGLELIGKTQIGASVGDEVKSSAFWSISISLIAILLYIAVRFEFGYGLGALVATVHDALMTIGLFVALGEFLHIGSGQFTAPMIAAVLMTMGYSINDTIVVFDRIREELEMNPGMNLKKVIHFSINRVLSRTLLTSLTTLFASLALHLFGAGVVVDFALVFLIGVITGTFSSIFIASPIFYWYHKGDRQSVEKGEILPTYNWTSNE